MKLLEKHALIEAFTGSKNSGFFEFSPFAKEPEGDVYSSLLNIVSTSFITESFSLAETFNEANELLNREYIFNINFFFYGQNARGHNFLDFITFDKIMLLRVYRDNSFELELKENLFTDEIYFYQQGENNDRADFRYAAKLNRSILSVALDKITRDSGSEVIDCHCELPIEITKNGFLESAALKFERQS